MKFFLVILVASCTAFAGGSIFSTQPTGDRITPGGVRAVGLSGAGLAIGDTVGTHEDNPAAIAYMTGAMLRAGMFSSYYSVADKDKSDSDSEFGWQAFRLYLNIHPRYKMGLGFDPVSRTDLRNFAQDTMSIGTDSVAIDQSFENRKVWLGSATNIRWDHAVKLSNKLAVGASAVFTSNYLELNQTLDFPTAGANGPRDIYYHNVQRYKGFFGGLSFIGRPTDQLSIAGFWNSEADGDWELDQSVNHGGDGTKTKISGKRPSELGIGVGYQWRRNWAGYLDFKQQSWKVEHFGPMFENEGLQDVDAMAIMLGAEKIGGTRVTDEGFDRWDYRAGVAYRKQPWQVLDGASIGDVSEMALSLGVSIPLAQQSGKLHTALEFGQRSAPDVDVNETFARFYMQLDMHESWFKRERRKL